MIDIESAVEDECDGNDTASLTQNKEEIKQKNEQILEYIIVVLTQ